MLRPIRTCRNCRGLSLVELLVGITLGLFVAAAAALMVATQLAEHRRLLLDAQGRQEMRRSADLVQRELRRAGHWRQAHEGLGTSAQPGTAPPFPDLWIGTSEVGLHYQRRPDQDGPFGFKLHEGALKVRLAGAGWHELTDPRRLRVTRFELEQALHPHPLAEKGESGEPVDCAPAPQTRHLRVRLQGHAVHDPSLQHQAYFQVQVRNDRPAGGAQAAAAPEEPCP